LIFNYEFLPPSFRRVNYYHLSNSTSFP
jgi:hypothetical protein